MTEPTQPQPQPGPYNGEPSPHLQPAPPQAWQEPSTGPGVYEEPAKQPHDPPTTYAPPSQYVQGHWPPLNETPQRPRKRGLSGAPLVATLLLLGVGGLVIGLTSGTAIGAANKPEQAPAVCIEALQHADSGFGISADAMGYAADALGAAGRFNVSDMREATEGIEEENQKFQKLSPKYKSAREACNSMK